MNINPLAIGKKGGKGWFRTGVMRMAAGEESTKTPFSVLFFMSGRGVFGVSRSGILRDRLPEHRNLSKGRSGIEGA